MKLTVYQGSVKNPSVNSKHLKGRKDNKPLLSKLQRKLKRDLELLPQDLFEMPKGQQGRNLASSLGLTTKSAKALLALPPNSIGAKQVYTLWERLRRFKGVKQATKILKELYTELIRYSCGLRLFASTSTWLKRDSDAFPTALSALKIPLRSGSVSERRATLGLIRAFESITIKPEVNVATIVTTSGGERKYRDQIHNNFAWFCNSNYFGKQCQRNFKNELTYLNHTGLIFSTKKSPYGGPTCGQLVYQYTKIKELNLIPLIKDWAKQFNRSDYDDIINMMEVSDTDVFKVNTPHDNLGKVSFISAPGAKTRAVAIVNYWLQDALYPLHKILYGVLSKIPSDGTFDQDSQAKRVQIASKTEQMYSFDLTAATDRLPLGPQLTVLRSLNVNIGSLWDKTLKELKFYIPEWKRAISYAVGQPMGIYSSWAMLALTHHFIIKYCAYKVGRNSNFDKYAIIGDDVTIWDNKVANEYLVFMDLLEVSVSPLKSFTPEVKDIKVAEFAKRIFCNGVNITPIPTLFQEAAWHEYTNWPTALSWLESNDYPIDQNALDTIYELAHLPMNNFNDLICLMYIWNLFHAPLQEEEVTKWLPEGFEEFNVNDVIKERLELLNIKLADVDFSDPVYRKVKGWKPSNKDEGLVCQPQHNPEPAYFKLMRETRLRAFIDLQTELSRIWLSQNALDLYGSSFKGPKLGFEAEYNPFDSSSVLVPTKPEAVDTTLLTAVQGIEYLPYPSYNNMVKEATANVQHWKLRNRYFSLIARRLSQRAPNE